MRRPWYASPSGLLLPGSDPLERRRRGILRPTGARGMSRRRCCCVAPLCYECLGNQAPSEILVTIPALTDGVCLSSCAALAGDYTLSLVADGNGNCYWNYSFGAGAPCGVVYLRVKLYSFQTTHYIEVVLWVDTYASKWIKTWVSGDEGLADCTNWNGESIPVYQTYYCITADPALITAL